VAFQWTKCVVHHLYFVYSSVSDQIIAFLVEVRSVVVVIVVVVVKVVVVVVAVVVVAAAAAATFQCL